MEGTDFIWISGFYGFRINELNARPAGYQTGLRLSSDAHLA